MKLHQDALGGHNVITGYGADHIIINHTPHPQSLVVLPDQIIEPWATSFDTLTAQDFAWVHETGVEVVLLGTGARQRFPSPALLRALVEARIGVEVMDLPAACRTYNILVGEGRRAAAALLLI